MIDRTASASSPSRTPPNCNCSSRTWSAWKPAPPIWKARGEINQRELLRNALRMRPDRIIVGEVRGAEAFDMLQAMNTGHDGSMSTVHANTTRDAMTPHREHGADGDSRICPPRAIRTQIVGALDLIIQIERMRDGVRRVSQVSEICGMEGEVITMNEVVSFQFDREDAAGGIVGHYVSAASRPSFATRLSYFDLENAWMDAVEDFDMLSPFIPAAIILLLVACVSAALLVRDVNAGAAAGPGGIDPDAVPPIR